MTPRQQRRRTASGRVMVLPVVFFVQLVWAMSILPVRAWIEDQYSPGRALPLYLLSIYGGVFLAIYLVLRLFLAWKFSHLAEGAELRVFGFNPAALYYRVGAGVVDIVGLLLSLILLVSSLIFSVLYLLAPPAALGVLGFFAGLVLGRKGPWPVRRRGGAGS